VPASRLFWPLEAGPPSPCPLGLVKKGPGEDAVAVSSPSPRGAPPAKAAKKAAKAPAAAAPLTLRPPAPKASPKPRPPPPTDPPEGHRGFRISRGAGRNMTQRRDRCHASDEGPLFVGAISHSHSHGFLQRPELILVGIMRPIGGGVVRWGRVFPPPSADICAGERLSGCELRARLYGCSGGGIG